MTMQSDRGSDALLVAHIRVMEIRMKGFES